MPAARRGGGLCAGDICFQALPSHVQVSSAVSLAVWPPKGTKTLRFAS